MHTKLTLPVLLAVLLLFTYNSYASVTTTYHPVYFATDSFTLTPDNSNQLAGLVNGLPATGEVELYISGHTDAEGNSAYNMNLSQRRVNAVQLALIQLGVAPNAIHIAYYGETRPTASNSATETKAKNRRVEVAVKHTVINSIADIAATDSAFMPQQFSINTATANTIKGRNGIQVTIPAQAFANAQGQPVSGNVTVTLTEYNDVASAFMHGITSMSTHGVLESGGMYRLQAQAGGQQLQLQQGKVMDVKIPSANPAEDMYVYTSAIDSNGQLVWVKTDNTFKPAGQPKDTRTITLARSKYAAFLNIANNEQTATVVPELKRFTVVEPVVPKRPVLRLDKPKTLAESGLRNITHNKKVQQKMLDRINQNIEKYNIKRKARYEAQMAVYLADSALYPEKQKAYIKQQMQFAEYVIEKRAELDSLVMIYSMGIVKKRMQYCIQAFLAQSAKGLLYNSDLPARIKQFCSSGALTMRNHNYEQKLREAYSVLVLRNNRLCNYEYFITSFEGYRAYANLTSQPEIKEILTALVNDNPYLQPAERNLQLAAIEKSSSYPGFVNPVVNSYYAATVGQLGYVNCDRLRSTDNVVALNINNMVEDAQSVAFVKGINASQNIYTGKNSFKKDEELRMLSVYFKDGRPLVAYQDVKAAAGQQVNLVYKEMKMQEFKQLMLSFI